MFALMAEYEAALIKERTQAGLAAARVRGRTGGRKPKMTPTLIDKAQRMYDARQFTMAEIAQSCGVTPMTIYRNITTRRSPNSRTTREIGKEPVRIPDAMRAALPPRPRAVRQLLCGPLAQRARAPH